MIKVLSIRSRSVFAPVCEANKPKENPINASRKAFEKKRTITLKENVNTLLKIANLDIQEAGDFIKELDELHKQTLKKVFKKKDKEEFESLTVINEDENIFKK